MSLRSPSPAEGLDGDAFLPEAEGERISIAIKYVIKFAIHII